MDNDTKTELAHIVLAAAQREHTTLKNELSHMILAAAQRECKNAKVAMSDGSAAGARVAMQHRWRLFGIHALARDLFEDGMIEGSYYGLIVETLDYAFRLDIRDIGAWAEERK